MQVNLLRPLICFCVAWTCAVAGALPLNAEPSLAKPDNGRGQGAANDLAKEIDANRKTNVRIIVLDASGNAASKARVHLRQTKHDFEVGLVLARAGWPSVADGLPSSPEADTGESQSSTKPKRDAKDQPRLLGDAKVLRCFSAISIERLTAWSKLNRPEGTASARSTTNAQAKVNIDPHAKSEADSAKASPRSIAKLLRQANRRGLTVRWGGLISADEAYNPDRLASMRGKQLSTTLQSHLRRTLGRYGRGVDGFDLYTHILGHDMVKDRLGLAMVRRLFQQASALAPSAERCLRLEEGFDQRRAIKAVAKVIDYQQAQVPVDRLAIDQTFDQSFTKRSFRLALERLTTLDLPIVISSLEVSASNPMQAGLNLKTILRRLFAQPQVRGIYFAGLHANSLNHKTAALLDDQAKPTPLGQTLDDLFYKRWRTDRTERTNRAGEIKTRVFAGTYALQADLPNGQHAQTRVHLPRTASNDEDDRKIVVLQPLKQSP